MSILAKAKHKSEDYKRNLLYNICKYNFNL